MADNSSNQKPDYAPYPLSQDTPPSNLIASGVPNTEDATWPINMDDDLGSWTEVLDSVSIDIDRHWIETALMDEEDQAAENGLG